MQVCVHTSSHLRLFPKERSLSLERPEAELHQLGLSGVSHESKCVDTPSICVPVASDGTMTRHSPEKGMHGRWLLTEEVPGRVVSRCRLRNLRVRLGLYRMDQVWELDGILNEEDRDVVSNDVYR